MLRPKKAAGAVRWYRLARAEGVCDRARAELDPPSCEEVTQKTGDEHGNAVFRLRVRSGILPVVAMRPVTARFLGRIAGILLRIYFRLYRTDSIGWDRVLEKRREGFTIVFALWHGELLTPIVLHRGEGVVTMASRSTDGEVITAMLHSINYRVSRGSTKKGGRKALEEMAEIMGTERRDGALTVDGPRGPAHVVQKGVVRLAIDTGSWIVPIGTATVKNRRLRSWDRFLVPLPFDRASVVHGEPFLLDPECDVDEACARIATAIEISTLEAERLVGRGRPAGDAA